MSLQTENMELKQKAKKHEDIMFCNGCERLIAQGDRKVKCSTCK